MQPRGHIGAILAPPALAATLANGAAKSVSSTAARGESMSALEPVISADSHICEIEACYAEIDPKFRETRPKAIS